MQIYSNFFLSGRGNHSGDIMEEERHYSHTYIYSKVSFKARYSSPSILLSAHHDNPRRGKEPKKRGDKNEGDNGKRKLDALV